jgi:hypothetical protein
MPMNLTETGLTYASAEGIDEARLRDMLLARSDWLRSDPVLLAELGLRLDAANIVDFGPVALSRVCAAHERESSERKRLEAMARATSYGLARWPNSPIASMSWPDFVLDCLWAPWRLRAAKRLRDGCRSLRARSI